jgi:hypothetical protein
MKNEAIIERAYSQTAKRHARKAVNKVKAQEPKPPPPVREEYVAPVVRHEDERIIPGLSGRGAILRADNLRKLLESGKLDAIQYSAGIDYLEIVEGYFATASGFARPDDVAGRVGGDGDPIRRYVKARPARIQRDGKVIGYIPTQRPRQPSSARQASDGWSHDKVRAMTGFQRVNKALDGMTRDQRTALCVLVIDPDRPYLPPLSLAAAVRRLFGYKDTACYARLTRWLREALDIIEPEIHSARQAMAA